MVEIRDIRHWDHTALEEVRGQYQRALHVLTTAGDDFSKLKLSGADWTGETAGKAMGKHGQLVQHGDTKAAGLSAIVKALGQAADAVKPLSGQINDAEELARKYGYQVGDNGQLTDLFEGKDLPKDIHPDDRARAKKQITADLQQVVRTANDIDHELASVFNKAGSDGYSGGPVAPLSMAAAVGKEATNLTPPDPPKHGTPAQNAAWWHTLSKNEHDALVKHAPEKIGNLDGVPAAYRSAANKAELKRLRSKFAERVKKMRHNMPKIVPDMKSSVDDYRDAQRRLHDAERKLKSLNNIDGVMSKGGKQLIHFDASKPIVQAAVANGNVDTATNVSVFTPWLQANTADDNFGRYDNNMYDLKNTSDRMLPPDSKASNATVTWLGYQPPQLDATTALPNKSVASPWAAKDGGDDLANFYKGIESSREGTSAGTPHITALGHSYGSTTTGYGLAHNTPVDDAMLFGSPGQGASKHLNVPDGHLYSEKIRVILQFRTVTGRLDRVRTTRRPRSIITKLLTTIGNFPPTIRHTAKHHTTTAVTWTKEARACIIWLLLLRNSVITLYLKARCGNNERCQFTYGSPSPDDCFSFNCCIIDCGLFW